MLLILFFLVATTLNAQISEDKIIIKGLITDSISGNELSYVTITIQKDNVVIKKVTANNSGKFSFQINSPGKYDLFYHMVGYATKKEEINVDGNQSHLDMGKIRLHEVPEKIGEITVTALKPLVRSEAEKLVYSVESDPESETANTLEIMRKVPMVAVNGDGISLRGMAGVKFLLNGKSTPVFDQNPGEALKSMPSYTVKDIEVITNPSSKYEAEGTAGIINIITRQKTTDGYNGRISGFINTRKEYQGGFYFSSKVKKFIYSVNLSVPHWIHENYAQNRGENYSDPVYHYLESNGYGKGIVNWKFANSEASYKIDSLSFISLSFNLRSTNHPQNNSGDVTNYDFNRQIISNYENESLADYTYTGFSGNINYQKQFKKSGDLLIFSY